MVRFSRYGKHIFGGELDNLEISGLPLPCNLHNFLTIDTTDKNSPVIFKDGAYLPLFYPLFYNGSGDSFSYRMIDDLKIEVTSAPVFDKENSFPALLPFRKAVLDPLPYCERRILHTSSVKPSFLDRLRLKRVWNRELFRVSGMIDSFPNRFVCLKPNGDSQFCDAWKIAEFPATKVPFGDIWNDFTSAGSFVFSFCLDCHQIHCHFDCT